MYHIDRVMKTSSKDTGKRYVVICRSGNNNLEIQVGWNKSTIFDPEQPTASKDNFNWMDAWQVTDKLKLETNELNEKPPLPMKGEGMLAEKTESGSVLIYWTGKGYHWYQIAD